MLAFSSYTVNELSYSFKEIIGRVHTNYIRIQRIVKRSQGPSWYIENCLIEKCREAREDFVSKNWRIPDTLYNISSFVT